MFNHFVMNMYNEGDMCFYVGLEYQVYRQSPPPEGWGYLANLSGIERLTQSSFWRTYGFDALFVHSLGVVVAHRRKGIASAILKEMIEYARFSEKRLLVLEVEADNAAAINMYEKIGFTRAENQRTKELILMEYALR